MIKFKDDLFSSEPKSRSLAYNQNESQYRRYPLTVELMNPSQNIIDTKAVFIIGDSKTSVIDATIQSNGKFFNLADYKVTINVRENYNMIETFMCDSIDLEKGIVHIHIPALYVDESGSNIFELVFQKGDNIIVSQKYAYKVLDSFGEGFIGSEVEMSTLQKLINEVQTQHDNIMSITSSLEVSSSDIDDIINMIG